jgi:hypothetical protein
MSFRELAGETSRSILCRSRFREKLCFGATVKNGESCGRRIVLAVRVCLISDVESQIPFRMLALRVHFMPFRRGYL